ncbi:hypothetical protein H5410_019324 [Solanum commersonii]|uniref:Uncharacterized protein n=1 Tax=Solanum commersonii TaxID=4109 RepID=A0A9J5Z4W8_SOLCO|nr:hypothetical protein H5410_019324 [Solanum commersonii]
MSFLPKIYMDFVNTFAMEPVGHHDQNTTGFIGDPEFRCYFCQKFTWTSDKTLDMESVGQHG